MNILDFIPKDKSKAITRAELQHKTGFSDRQIRREIKKLLMSGIPIISTSSSAGYWLSDDENEWERFIAESDRRMRSEWFTTRRLRKKLYKRKGISTVTVREHVRRVFKNKKGYAND